MLSWVFCGVDPQHGTVTTYASPKPSTTETVVLLWVSIETCYDRDINVYSSFWLKLLLKWRGSFTQKIVGNGPFCFFFGTIFVVRLGCYYGTFSSNLVAVLVLSKYGNGPFCFFFGMIFVVRLAKLLLWDFFVKSSSSFRFIQKIRCLD